MIPTSVAANRTIIPLISFKPPSAVFVIEICADALPEDKPVIKAKVNIAVMKRFMGFLSEAAEGEVLKNEPAYRISESPNFENNHRIGCFALKQHGSCKMLQQKAT
jgi:hypothetical protein